MTANEDLGDFLRARRARLHPEQVGLPSHGQRRVPGLRREEVAVLAGMNVDYYARLEQGRERHPSPQILEAISGALRLDQAAREHLHRLAGLRPQPPRPAEPGLVGPGMRQLLDSWPHTPAFVLDPALNLLATNALADALFSPFGSADNLARMVFLDPVGREFYADWEQAAHGTVAALRQATGTDPDNPRLTELVTTLRAASREFSDLWQSHAVGGKTFDTKRLRHPDVGALTLSFQSFDLRGAAGLELVVYHADPTGPTARALALLGSLHATLG
ncbi:helix-turn-helix transcriptional regulator [Nocardia heshunensis]